MTPQLVKYIPAERADGVLYVSLEHGTAVHSCPCGCGNKVVTPLNPAGWRISWNGVGVSLAPSIGNWQFPCQSHYWIDDGLIRWSGTWTRQQIRRGAALDNAAVVQMISNRDPQSRFARTLTRLIRRLRDLSN